MRLPVFLGVRSNVEWFFISRRGFDSLWSCSSAQLRALGSVCCLPGVDKVDVRRTELAIAGQELITRDKIGARVEHIGVKDIILPGEMKALLNRVIEAEKRRRRT